MEQLYRLPVDQLIKSGGLFFFTLCFFLYLFCGQTGAAERPLFRFAEDSTEADYEYTILWEDSDSTDHSLSFYYRPADGAVTWKLIVMDIPVSGLKNTYIWNTASVADGEYVLSARYLAGDRTYTYQLERNIIISHTRSCLDTANRENLLLNPGFEHGGSTPDNWQIIVPKRDRTRSWRVKWHHSQDFAHSGEAGMELSQVFNGVNSSSAWKDRVIIESSLAELSGKSKKYLLSAWLKTTDIEPGHIMFRVKYYDRSGRPLQEQGHRWDTYYFGDTPTPDWQQALFLVEPPAPDRVNNAGHDPAHRFSLAISLDHSPGSVLVDDISLIALTAEEYEQFRPVNLYRAPEIVPVADKVTIPPSESQDTRLFNNSGTWWLVDPEQNVFWPRGATISTNDLLLEVSGETRNGYLKQAAYRSGKDLNFNQGIRIKETKGNGYSTLVKNIVWLNFSSEADINSNPEHWVAKDRDGHLIADKGHYFADVFSPTWQEYSKALADSLLKDDGWAIDSTETIGYWTDNEWAYGDLHDFIWGDSSKLAFIDWLRGKNDLPSVRRLFEAEGSAITLSIPKGFEHEKPYTDIESVNKAWSSAYHRYRFSSFTDIIKQDQPLVRAHDDPVAQDLYKFERLIYKIYVDTVVDNIRRVERIFSIKSGTKRKHLIFSNRFSVEKVSALSRLKRNMDLFERFDVIAVNIYPVFNQLGAYYPFWLLSEIRSTFHDTTGRPLYIAEFGLAAEDANDCRQKPCMAVRRWRPNTVSFQHERGWTYNNIMATFANLPYVVGANWFKWANGYGIPQGSDIRNSGVVDDFDHYYSDFTDNVRSTNHQIDVMKRSNQFSLQDIDWSATRLRTCDAEKH